MALSYRILLTLLNLFCSGLCVLSNFYLADYPSQLLSSNLVHNVCWLGVDDSTPPYCGIDQQYVSPGDEPVNVTEAVVGEVINIEKEKER
ncbi:hypothetical protein B0A49_03957 [Cryomyces minteri]|uniref:Uncharacterized protein n=1 Tax=Cryomyces minteri TaxID=331657 RepID=A0A4U0XKN9_9PEZI|nr:hypothetical protein B0A49_03957 [Cryomyces minteri]